MNRKKIIILLPTFSLIILQITNTLRTYERISKNVYDLILLIIWPPIAIYFLTVMAIAIYKSIKKHILK